VVRRPFSVLLVTALFLSIHAVASPPAFASGDCYGNYHFAGETVVDDGYGGWYYAPSCRGPQYFGWIGINGQVTVPSQVPFIGISTQHNHSAGWIGIAMQPNSFVQEGWFTGCGVQYCRYGSIGYYTEVQNGTVSPW
jgi:hypothetical protein